MRKYIYILLLSFIFILANGCYYKELSDSDSVVLAENETMSVVFLLNEYGYGESNRFVTKVSNGSNISVCEGKLYKNSLNYKDIIVDNNYSLHNYINNILFYTSENGLQGANFEEELISDAPYNYLQNGYGELILNIGNDDPYISLFDNSNNNLISNIDNKHIIYVSHNLDTMELNNVSTVYKSNVYLYQINDIVYLKKDYQSNSFNENTGNQESKSNSIEVEIAEISNIKKGFIIDSISSSFTIIQTYDNVIYAINNNTLELKTIKKFNNIATVNRVDNYFYIIENNIVYIYNDHLNEVKKINFEDKIIGSAWYKEVNSSYIKLALLSSENKIILDRINIVE